MEFVSQLEVATSWSDEPLSEPIELWVLTKNIGQLTALDVTLNYVFPATIDVRTPSRPIPAETLGSLEGNFRRIILAGRTLNPQQIMPSHFALRVPRGLDQFEVRVTTTLRDAVEEDAVLTVRTVERTD